MTLDDLDGHSPVAGLSNAIRRTFMRQFTGYHKTDRWLRTVYATSENAFLQGLEITAHCDS